MCASSASPASDLPELISAVFSRAELARLLRQLGARRSWRIFTPVVVVWALVLQRLSADHTIDAVVSLLHAGAADHLDPDDPHALPLSQRIRSQNTAAFAQARARTPLGLLTALLQHVAARAEAHLSPRDAVVLESTTNAWAIYDLVAPLEGRAVVAHPGKVKLIAHARVKTDKVDVLSLARLLRADMIPEVWVPPLEVRDLRALLSHRRRLVSQQTTLKNRLQSVLHRLNVPARKGELFAQKQRAWWSQLVLSATERLRVDHDLATLEHVAGRLAT